MFQNLRVNNQLYILHKEAKHFIEIGSVVSVSAPKPKYPMPAPMGQMPQMRWLLMSWPILMARTQHFRIFHPVMILPTLDKMEILLFHAPVMQ